ncbi:DNA-binding protein [Candidatus Promineifilum breve]|uniref:DNA-binding protein n=1 Tax=Candidatus Promineifilum breve TaxID=1806508 RepID=A0A160T5Y0_9CHLR|nr:DNA-binding protein [Candidatus Promineifilum breve]
MEIKPIRNEVDYKEAMAELDRLWGAEPNTPEGDKLDILVTLIEAYEGETDPIGPPDPIEALFHFLERQELTPRALVPYIGNEGEVMAVLERRLPLSLDMIRRLHAGLDIPADVLIQTYQLETA